MDSNAIQKLFMQHVEKGVLVGIGAFALFLIYQGMGFPRFQDTEFQPTALAQKANQVKGSIDDPHNDEVLALLPEAEPRTYVERIQQLQKPIPFDEYPHSPFEPRDIDISVKRQDVALLPPMDLQMSGMLSAMAVQAKLRTTYLVRDLEDAPEPEEEEEKPRRRDRSRGRNARGTGDQMEMGMEMGMGMDEGGMAMPGMGAMEMGMGPGMSGSMTRRLNSKYNKGAEAPANAEVAATAAGAAPQKRPLNTVPESAYFIAGTAVVPHKALVEAFHATYEKTRDYRAVRDRPIYVGYEFQRADVTEKSVEQIVDGDWVDLTTKPKYNDDWDRINQYALHWWNGYAPDIVPADYRDPKLTSLIPPLLIYDFTTFATHPKIPLKTMLEIEKESRDPLDQVQVVDIFNNENDGDAAVGAEGGSGMPRGGMRNGGSVGVEKNPPEFKMIRFYDFYDPRFTNPPLPGRRYVYRVRYKLEDPNFPKLPSQAPSLRSLAPEVFQRVVPKMKEAETTKKRDFVIRSPWSEPSPVTELPRPMRIYAGPIVAPAESKEVEIANRVIDYVRSPATAKAVATIWDWRHAVAVPAPFDVQSGTVMNATLDAEVVDPLTMKIKTKPNSSVNSNAVVLDIVGGEPLKLEEEFGLTRPGMMLVFDPMGGGLKVMEEIDDKFDFSMYTFTDDVVPVDEDAAGSTVPGMEGFDYMGAEGGAMMMEGF